MLVRSATTVERFMQLALQKIQEMPSRGMSVQPAEGNALYYRDKETSLPLPCDFLHLWFKWEIVNKC